MFEIVYDDGRRLNGYTISSPCEPNGSGELKKHAWSLYLEIIFDFFIRRIITIDVHVQLLILLIRCENLCLKSLVIIRN